MAQGNWFYFSVLISSFAEGTLEALLPLTFYYHNYSLPWFVPNSKALCCYMSFFYAKNCI